MCVCFDENQHHGRKRQTDINKQIKVPDRLPVKGCQKVCINQAELERHVSDVHPHPRINPSSSSNISKTARSESIGGGDDIINNKRSNGFGLENPLSSSAVAAVDWFRGMGAPDEFEIPPDLQSLKPNQAAANAAIKRFKNRPKVNIYKKSTAPSNMYAKKCPFCKSLGCSGSNCWSN